LSVIQRAAVSHFTAAIPQYIQTKTDEQFILLVHLSSIVGPMLGLKTACMKSNKMAKHENEFSFCSVNRISVDQRTCNCETSDAALVASQ
jgi:hypothetical protein